MEGFRTIALEVSLQTASIAKLHDLWVVAILRRMPPDMAIEASSQTHTHAFFLGCLSFCTTFFLGCLGLGRRWLSLDPIDFHRKEEHTEKLILG